MEKSDNAKKILFLLLFAELKIRVKMTNPPETNPIPTMSSKLTIINSSNDGRYYKIV